jgi:phosphoenolpyruvate carboxykinase (ATP)
MKDFVDNKELFVFDGFVGADPETRLPIRVINDHVWQSMFSSNLFIRPTDEELEKHEPEFTILCINDFLADPEIDGTRTDVFILIDLTRKIVLIGGTEYAGEMKKSMFGVMNFLLPDRNIFPMHCSANIGDNGDTALFFGLSGTGKTTLSADPNRKLIGDDEHGWSDNGTFNFEGGCYAKCINLSQEAEPEIWNAIKPGALLENVVLNDNVPDYDDNSLTENTRVGYPLDFIPGAVIPSVGGNPRVIVFLTADALGVLPPVSRLTKEGAMYHFMSGYTSKLAGTERGIKEPKSVFSQCFGAPFMPRPASVYAKLLGEKINQHNTVVYLVNTGWSGGPYGVGKRIKIKYSRAMVTAAISGALDIVKYRHDDLLNLDIPTEVEGVPSEILDPKHTWVDKDSYDLSAKKLAQMFVENFKKFENVSDDIIAAGPKFSA